MAAKKTGEDKVKDPRFSRDPEHLIPRVKEQLMKVISKLEDQTPRFEDNKKAARVSRMLIANVKKAVDKAAL